MSRIVFDQKILKGKAVIKGTRISVDLILELLAHGWTEKEILKEYPQLKKEDIKACLKYSAKRLKNEDIIKV